MTAEAAVVLPTLAVLTVALVWMVAVAVTQVRVVDAARDAARAVARGEDTGSVVAAAQRTAPDRATVHIQRSGVLVKVVVTAETTPLHGVLPIPPVTVSSTSVVEAEDVSSTAP